MDCPASSQIPRCTTLSGQIQIRLPALLIWAVTGKTTIGQKRFDLPVKVHGVARCNREDANERQYWNGKFHLV